MFCSNCGARVSRDAKFCMQCGAHLANVVASSVSGNEAAPIDSAPRCSYPGCAAPTAHKCLTCGGGFCVQHARLVISSYPSHYPQGYDVTGGYICDVCNARQREESAWTRAKSLAIGHAEGNLSNLVPQCVESLKAAGVKLRHVDEQNGEIHGKAAGLSWMSGSRNVTVRFEAAGSTPGDYLVIVKSANLRPWHVLDPLGVNKEIVDRILQALVRDGVAHSVAG